MKLFKVVSVVPILLEGEGSIANSHFQVGASCGKSVITEIEATPMGVIVRREGDAPDLFIVGSATGILLHKATKAGK